MSLRSHPGLRPACMVTGQRTRSPSRGRGGHNLGAPRTHSESPRAPRKRGGRRQPQGLVTAPFPHTHSRPLEWCNPPLIQKRLQSQWADPASFSPSTSQSATRLPPLGWPGPCPGPWERFTPWCRRRLRSARAEAFAGPSAAELHLSLSVTPPGNEKTNLVFVQQCDPIPAADA